MDRLPFATEVYRRDLVIENYNMPFLQYPYVSFYTSRGCPALCTFCLWPQTLSGHDWRVRSANNVAEEVRRALKFFPQYRGGPGFAAAGFSFVALLLAIFLMPETLCPGNVRAATAHVIERSEMAAPVFIHHR